MALEPEELAAFLEALDGTDFSFFQVERGDARITVTRGEAGVVQRGLMEEGLPAESARAAASTPARATGTEQSPAGVPAPSDVSAGGTETVLSVDTVAIKAPMMGTFYAAPKPGESAFVRGGDVVEPDTVVGIIEVMKLMTPVTAGVSGVIAAVCIDNGQLVDFEQPLFRVKTSA